MTRRSENDHAKEVNFRWNPFVIVEIGGHEMRIRKGSAITVLREPEQSNVFRAMAEKGWLDEPEFAVTSESLTEEERYVLEGLKQNGAVHEVHTAGLPSVVTEFHARSGAQTSTQEIAIRLGRTVVHVAGDHVTFIEELLEALGALRVSARAVEVLNHDSVRGFGDSDIVVAAYLDLFAETASRDNELLVKSGFPGRVFFMGGFNGHQSVVGPWMLARRSACLACWNMRRRANLVDVPSEFRPGASSEALVAHYGTRSALPSCDRIAVSYAADIITEFVLLGEQSSSSRPGSYGTVGFSRNGIAIERHHVLRVPRCAVCGRSQSTGYPQVWHHGR